MQIIKNSAIYLGSSILNKAIPFMLLPILTEYLSPSEYGIVAIFQIIITFFTAIVGMAIHTNVSKNFFQYKKKQMARHVGNMMLVLCASTFIVLLITFVATFFFKELFSIPASWLMVMPILSFMFMVNTINLTILRMKGNAFTYGVFEISNTIVNMTLSVILLVFYEYGWYSRAYGILGAYFLFFILGMIYMYNKGYLKYNFDRKEIGKILKISVPLIPHALGSIIIAMSDRFFIEKMVGIEAVGIYTVGYMFGMIVMLFTDAFIKAWSPWFFKSLSNPNESQKRKIVKYTYLYIVGIFILSIFVSLFGNFVLPYFVGEEFYDARKYIMWVALGYVFFGIYQIFFLYLVHIGKTSFLAISTVISAVANVVLNYIFITHFGTIGAAYATIVAFIISSGLIFWYQKKHYSMPWVLNN